MAAQEKEARLKRQSDAARHVHQCGECFCDSCGDCLHCYGEDPCYRGNGAEYSEHAGCDKVK
ncbi:MAG: hypothetical protein V3T08_09840 [Gemmatimonadota bacterium]